MTVRDVETLELLRERAGVARNRRRGGIDPAAAQAPSPACTAAAAAVLAAVAVALLAPWQNEDGGGLVPERALAALPTKAPVMHGCSSSDWERASIWRPGA